MKELLRKYYLLCTKVLSILIFSLLLSVNLHALDETEEDYNLKLLGKHVFFAKISSPERMACVTCHDPATGWTGSVSGVNLKQVAITGANPHMVGNVKPPTNAYASFAKPFEKSSNRFGTNFTGGNFWDGRAEGNVIALYSGATKHIGDEIFQGTDKNAYAKYFGPTSDQALNPMPNPVEQNIEQQAVCMTVESSKLAPLYELVWGVEIDCSSNDVAVSAPDVDTPEKAYNISFKRLMLAIGAWQHSEEVNSFSSKRDIALRAELACFEGSPDADPDVCNHPNYIGSEGKFPLVGFTDQENLGHDIFYNVRGAPARGNCIFCHRDNGGEDGSELKQLYTSQLYRNIGTPFNPEMPTDQPSRGLSSHIDNNSSFDGFFKTPTLRNVDKRKDKDFIKAYMHNGWFKSLESVVHFYNTAAVDRATAASFGITRCEDGVLTEKDALAKNCWPEPEFDSPNSIGFVLGNLGMNAEQEAALVAYLKTLSDTITVKAPKPYNKKK